MLTKMLQKIVKLFAANSANLLMYTSKRMHAESKVDGALQVVLERIGKIDAKKCANTTEIFHRHTCMH